MSRNAQARALGRTKGARLRVRVCLRSRGYRFRFRRFAVRRQIAKDEIRRFLRLRRRDDDQLGVRAQPTNPAVQIGRAAVEGRGFDSGYAAEKRRAHLGYEFLLRVVAVSEVPHDVRAAPSEPLFVSGRMR